MQWIFAINVLVLVGLFLFLCREGWRFRRLTKHIEATKADLTSIVYQLRTPLSNLRKYNDFLQGKEFGRLSFAQQEAISKVQLSVGDSLRLIDRLLARSRLDEAKVTTQPSSLNVRDIVAGAIDAIKPIAQGKKHTVTVGGNTRVRMFVDPIVLHGILDELLSNAVHYTPQGGTITVTIVGRGTSVAIAVRDTGIGISDEERPHVFEKFYRGERAKPMFAGNGLGLSFAKQFAGTLRGTIRFTSKEKKGSVFTLSIPTNVRA